MTHRYHPKMNPPPLDSRSYNTLLLQKLGRSCDGARLETKEQTVRVLISLIFRLRIRVRIVWVSGGRGQPSPASANQVKETRHQNVLQISTVEINAQGAEIRD
jgi:hypothetical protein